MLRACFLFLRVKESKCRESLIVRLLNAKCENVNVIEQVLQGRAVMFLFPSACRARQRRESSWDNGGRFMGGEVCVCIFFIVCVAGVSAKICVY